MSDSKISNFVEKRLEMVGEACTYRFALTHEVEGSKPRTLLNCVVQRSSLDAEKERIPEEISEAAKSHAEEASRIQRYSIVAYAQDDSVLAMCPFRLKPSSSDASSELDSEPATSKGIVAQLMRHNESLTRVYMQSFQATATMLAEEVARLRRRNDELEDKNIDMISTFEALYSEKHKRDIEVSQEIASESRKERLLEQGEKLLPFIAAKLTGQSNVQRFVDTLSEEDMMALLTTLKPNQIEALKGVLSEGEKIKKLTPNKDEENDATE